MNAQQRLELQRITQKTLQQTQSEPATDLDALAQVPVQIVVGLGETTLPIQDLLKLKKGTTLSLNKKVGDPVDIYANNRLIGHGELTLADDHFGVIMTEVL